MAGIRSFTGGLVVQTPRDASPPGTLRRGAGLALTAAAAAVSRWGLLALIENVDLPRRSVRFNGSRYYQAGSSFYDPSGTVLFSGFTSLRAASVVVAPVSLAKPDYLFIATNNGMKKVSPAGVLSDWGIAPFGDDWTVAAGTREAKVIDALDATTGWSALGTTGAPSASTDRIEGTHSVTFTTADLTFTGAIYSIVKDITIDLTAHTGGAFSGPEDYIALWVKLNEPLTTEYVLIGFALGAVYSAGIAADEFTTTARFDAGVPNILTIAGISSDRTEDEQRALVADTAATVPVTLNTAPTTTIQRTHGRSAQADYVQASQTTIPPVGSRWHRLRIPKAAFTRSGTGAYTWANVKSVKLGIKSIVRDKAIGVTSALPLPIAYFDDLRLEGGYGTRGTYRFYITAKNSTTGNESQPNPTYKQVEDVDRQPFAWVLPTTHPDTQVDTIVGYSPLGDGGVYFKRFEVLLADLPGSGAYTDEVADAPGMLSGSTDIAYLQTDELRFDNIKPEGHYADACGPHLGRIWMTRDVTVADSATATTGRGSRVYYTRAGYVEGVQGFVSIGNDDELCQRLVIWNRNIYVLTRRGMWQLAGVDEPFIPLQIRNVPGTRYADSVAATPFGIVYEADDGIRVFNGTTAPLAIDAIAGIFRGETLEGITAWAGSLCAAAGLDYYYVSDGVTLLHLDSTGRWRNVGVTGASALDFEPSTGLFIVGVAQGTGENQTFSVLESEGALTDGTGAEAIAVEWEPAHVRLSDTDQAMILRRVSIDIDLAGQTLTPTLIVDGVEVALAPITNTTRGVIEIAQNRPCRLLGLRLAGSVSARVTWYGADPDVWMADSTR